MLKNALFLKKAVKSDSSGGCRSWSRGHEHTLQSWTTFLSRN